MQKLLYTMMGVMLLLLPAVATAQEPQEAASWQQTWHELMATDETDEDGEAWEDTFEQLQQLAEQPLNLNTATRQDLEQLPFLSEQQVMDMVEYIERYGPVRSLTELRMVRSLDYVQLQLLPHFVFVESALSKDTRQTHPSWENIARYGRHELTATARLPFYRRAGDKNGYLGYPVRHELRYEMKYSDCVRAGLIGTQDAGEPFLAAGNSWGYDNYSYYLQLRRLGIVQNLVAGKYKLSIGMGLVLGSGFSMGKLVAMQSLSRQTGTPRPHTSRSVTSYMQGVAATLTITPTLSLTPYLSYRPIDATLNNEGGIATILTTGYHRTPTEMDKKHNAHQSDAGLHLQLKAGPLRGGITAAYTHLDRPLQPNSTQAYRRFQAAGHDFLNISTNYGYVSSRLTLQGETAADAHGHLATLNALSYSPAGTLRLTAIQRFYSYRYQSIHGYSLSEGGHTQNESGLMAGLTWQPLAHWQLQAYADYAYFPWLRYRVSASSEATDVLGQAIYQHSRWTVKGRWRWHRQQRDHTAANGTKQLLWHASQRATLSAAYAPSDQWNLTTQADLSTSNVADDGTGWMLSERATWQLPRLLLCLTAAYFNTHSYASRLYLYERQPAHNFGFASYYGHGIRLSLMARADIGRHWRLTARLGGTHRFDTSTIGSDLQLIDGSTATDLDLQLRYRFGPGRKQTAVH